MALLCQVKIKSRALPIVNTHAKPPHYIQKISKDRLIQSEPQFRICMGWFAGLWLVSVLLQEKRLWTSGWNPVLVVAHLVLHTIHFAQSCPTSQAAFQLPPPAVNFVFNIKTLSPVDHVSKHLFSFSHVAIAATQVTQKGLCLAVQRFAPANRVQVAVV